MGRMQGGEKRRTGAWLIGSRGSVAGATITGAAAIAAGLAPATGVVTMRPPFTGAALPALGDLVFGGHDLVETPLAVRAARLVDGGVIPPGLPEAVAPQLAAAEAEMRSGVAYREARAAPGAAVARVVADLDAFRSRHRLDHVVVINVCSTEPPAEPHPAHADPDALPSALNRGLGVLPPSSLYALAAIEAGCAFIDFTPSTGARLPALEALARAHEVPLGGQRRQDRRDADEVRRSRRCSPPARCACARGRGRTCSAAATARRSPIPPARSRRSRRKDRVLDEILGYTVEAPVRIDHVRDLGEWKTAWDHIHFEGFLGVRMKLQFTWEGCDSALAAPLLLDLARLGALALERGEAGFVEELAFFFKDPAGADEHALDRQFAMLERWALQEIAA